MWAFFRCQKVQKMMSVQRNNHRESEINISFEGRNRFDTILPFKDTTRLAPATATHEGRPGSSGNRRRSKSRPRIEEETKYAPIFSCVSFVRLLGSFALEESFKSGRRASNGRWSAIDMTMCIQRSSRPVWHNDAHPTVEKCCEWSTNDMMMRRIQRSRWGKESTNGMTMCIQRSRYHEWSTNSMMSTCSF